MVFYCCHYVHFREFVDEAYERGRNVVMAMKKEDMEKPLKKRGPESAICTIDPTLFDIGTEGTDQSTPGPLLVSGGSLTDLEPFIEK